MLCRMFPDQAGGACNALPGSALGMTRLSDEGWAGGVTELAVPPQVAGLSRPLRKAE